MEIEKDSLDDVLISLYNAIISGGRPNVGSRGETRELLGVLIRIKFPRARLSRSENRGKPFSALGELLWYLSKQNDVDFIKHYVKPYEAEAEEDGRIHGGYGPRLFSMRGDTDQVQNIIELLKQKPSTRRAVIQLFNAEDIKVEYKEIPCTTTMQFFRRDDSLHMAVTMRSNDAYKGLPHDVFCFTMLQEMIACHLGLDLGEYQQFVGSMHYYSENHDNLVSYIEEGYQKLAEMPPMPMESPFADVQTLLECERRLRSGESLEASMIFADPYWADILRLLQAFWASGYPTILDSLAAQFESPVYRTYLESRRTMRKRSVQQL